MRERNQLILIESLLFLDYGTTLFLHPAAARHFKAWEQQSSQFIISNKERNHVQ